MDSGASGRPAACAAMTARDGAIVARREAVTMRGALTRAGVAPRRRAGATARRTTSSQSHPIDRKSTRQLQSRSDLVCRLLLEKKKKKHEYHYTHTTPAS